MYMAFAIGLTWFSLILFLLFVDLPAFKNQQVSQAKKQLNQMLKHAQKTILIDLHSKNATAIQAKIDILATEPDIDIVVIADSELNPIFSSQHHSKTISLCTMLKAEECNAIKSMPNNTQTVILQEKLFITGIMPIIDNDSNLLLIIRTDISELDSITHSMLINHFVTHTILILMLVAIFILGGIFLINNPLAKLRNEVETFREGKPFAPFNALAPLEITNLGHAFETMTINLNATLLMLKNEKTKFEATFEQAAVGIAHVAPDGSWMRVNQKLCDIVGYTHEELLGSTFQDITHPDDLDTDLEYVHQMLSHERTSYTMRKRYLDKEQNIIWVDLTVSLVLKSNGEPDFFISVVEDINDQVKTESELRTQEAMVMFQSRLAAMGEMIGMIAHQWRQPLTVISMEANTIILNAMMKKLEEDETVQNAHKILNMTQHLSKTIDDFRNFFSPDKEKEISTIGNVINDAVALIDKSLEHNAIELITKIDTDSPLNLYTRELSQVFVNILKNAKEALIEKEGSDRKIWITAGQNETDVVITIANNGGNISEETLPHIFEPYFTTKHPSGGTGLGLYMSKIIVEKHHNGKIDASNIENGCIFRIAIPHNQENR